MNPTEDQNPVKDRPTRRLSPEEVRAALAHSLTTDEVLAVTGHQSLETTAAYRRETQIPKNNPLRTLRVTGATLAQRAGFSFQEIADELGHRSDTAALYVHRKSPFEQEVEGLDQQ